MHEFPLQALARTGFSLLVSGEKAAQTVREHKLLPLRAVTHASRETSVQERKILLRPGRIAARRQKFRREQRRPLGIYFFVALGFPERCLRLSELLTFSAEQEEGIGAPVAQHMSALPRLVRTVLSRRASALLCARNQREAYRAANIPARKDQFADILALVQGISVNVKKIRKALSEHFLRRNAALTQAEKVSPRLDRNRQEQGFPALQKDLSAPRGARQEFALRRCPETFSRSFSECREKTVHAARRVAAL